MAKLEIDGVRKAFDPAKVILDSVSLECEDGQFLSLLGPSGCGKTTLLRIIAGLETADSGRVVIGSTDVTKLSPKDRDIAMVFQNYALYPHLTVEENIGMGLKLRGVAASTIAEKVKDASGRLGLTELLKRRPAALSGGQRQRVAVARALVRDPKVFLLDEPLSNLDAVLRERTRGELRLLFKRVKGTVVYVTHDQIEAMTMSDRVAVLNKGVLQQFGTPAQIYHKPANTFVATFLGAPPMNLIAPEKAKAAGLGEGRVVGIRPEDVEVSSEAKPGLREAPVLLAEPTGPSVVLTVDVAGAELRALAPATWDTHGTKAYVGLPEGRLHRFFPATGQRADA